ncbi:MAG: SDR family NAD(P)-dependent oxidoreductase [Alphaproteobacteria bacterium]
MHNPRHIAITGASSGIGAALAELYAAPGITLSLQGRNAARLAAIAAAAQAKGAVVATGLVDVTDRAALEEWLLARDMALPVDLLIANAGISGGTASGGESPEQTRRIFATNVDGVFNTIHALLPAMTARRRGQIALMASLAGFRGLPGAPAYSASKATVRIYGEALRGDIAPHGIEVNVICPGYVTTPMTAINQFTMPFLMSAEKAAKIIRDGLTRNKSRIAFPFPTYLAVWLLAALPPCLTDWIVARLPKK